MNPNKSMTLIGTAIVIAAAGSSGMAVAGIDGSGTTKPKVKVTKGPITGFGSIYVNGVRFETNSALFLINGEYGSESQLEVGQIVTVHGSVNADGATGQATLVTYDDSIQGPIDNIDITTGRLSVMGHDVVVDVDTAFSDDLSSLAELNVSDIVEVSGFMDAAGTIRATHIGIETDEEDFDLHGVVDWVDSASLRFAVNGAEIDYRAANLLGFEYGAPQVGELVRILGDDVDETGQLIATRIEQIGSGNPTAAGSEMSIEGIVTGLRSFYEFEIDGTPVRLRWGTEFVDGSVFSLNVNSRVDVDGKLDASGVLIADRIEFERTADLRTSGTVAAVFAGALLVDGRIVRVTPETGYDDRSLSNERRFNIDDVRPGDTVDVSGFEEGGTIVATRLERAATTASLWQSFGNFDDRD